MIIKFVLLLLVSLCSLDAKMFQSIKRENGEFIQKGDTKLYCSNCGMSLVKYYKTSHVHKNHQYCSLHCLYDVSRGKVPRSAKVVDTKTLKLIPVKNAYYVVDSNIRGTMTWYSKYAFGNLNDAKKFQKKYGGKIMDFQEVYLAASKDFKKDLKMIQTKNVKKTYRMGKKLYDKSCFAVELGMYISIADLKSSLKNNCRGVRADKKLQAIATYLWDIEKTNKQMNPDIRISIPKDAKCPICGMFAYKYPKWVAVIEKKDKNIYFDGCKDMFKYYISRKEKISSKKIFATDYFSGKKISGYLAYYVMGSNVYGPMGNELIPFKSELDANAFRKDHFGTKVLKFLQVVEDKDIIKDLEEL